MRINIFHLLSLFLLALLIAAFYLVGPLARWQGLVIPLAGGLFVFILLMVVMSLCKH